MKEENRVLKKRAKGGRSEKLEEENCCLGDRISEMSVAETAWKNVERLLRKELGRMEDQLYDLEGKAEKFENDVGAKEAAVTEK